MNFVNCEKIKGDDSTTYRSKILGSWTDLCYNDYE